MSIIATCSNASFPLDMQSEFFMTAVKAPAMLIMVQLAQAIIVAQQLNETPLQLGNRVVSSTIKEDIAAASLFIQQLFAEVMRATYAIIAQCSTADIDPVLQSMGQDLSYRFIATHALPKTLDFAAELQAQGYSQAVVKNNGLRDVTDSLTFISYLDRKELDVEKEAEQLIQVIERKVLADQFVVYGYSNVRQYLETQIVYASYYDNCPANRVSRLKALLEKVPKKELDFSPTKEVFIRSNENRIKIDNLSKEKAITYACEVGEKLTSFDLSLYSGKVTLEDLTRLVQACPNIQQLDLDSLKLDGFPSSKKVTDAILKHTKLESLRITGYGLDPEFFEKLVDIKNLKKLDISYCYFGNSSIQKLTKLEHIESLTLQGNRARYGGYSPALTDEVLDLLKAFPKLQTVNLTGQKISLDALEKFKNENPKVEVIIDTPTKPVS